MRSIIVLFAVCAVRTWFFLHPWSVHPWSVQSLVGPVLGRSNAKTFLESYWIVVWFQVAWASSRGRTSGGRAQSPSEDGDAGEDVSDVRGRSNAASPGGNFLRIKVEIIKLTNDLGLKSNGGSCDTFGTCDPVCYANLDTYVKITRSSNVSKKIFLKKNFFFPNTKNLVNDPTLNGPARNPTPLGRPFSEWTMSIRPTSEWPLRRTSAAPHTTSVQ